MSAAWLLRIILSVAWPGQGVVHITGGGFPENIPRVVPKGADLGFRIQRSAWDIPPLFRWLQEVTWT
jgi:phosphoribosylformylglycinamidine cyclo-ligase